MKRVVLMVLMGIALINATTVSGVRNVSVNGTIQGENGAANGSNGASWENDEVQSTSTGGVDFYLTWDDNNLYVGWVGGSKSQQHIVWIDTDPQPTPTDGSGSVNTFDYGNITATLPFTGNFFVNIQDTYNEYRTNTGGTWSGGTSGALTVSASGTTDDIEAVIPWNTITNGNGRPGSIYFFSYINDPAGGGGTGFVYGNAPSQNTNSGGGNQTFSHYFGQTVTGGVNPFGTVDASLAVELSAFTVVWNGRYVELNWTTESELNNAGYIIYRRRTGRQEFEKIADFRTVPGLRGAGNSSQPHVYHYADSALISAGTYEYRLADVDYTGRTDFSRSVRVEVTTGGADPSSIVLYPNYPNPFNPATTIAYYLRNDDVVHINIYDLNGRKVRTLFSGYRSAGEHSLVFNAQGLASGVYIYRLLTEKGVVRSRRMLLIR